MKERLEKILKTIDNLEENFKGYDIEVIFALEELKAQIEEISNVVR